MNIEITKKTIAVWSTIGSLTLALLGFIGAQYFEMVQKHIETIQSNQTELRLIKQKINDDDSQWQILKEQDEKIKAQQIELKVLKIRVQRMFDEGDRNIVVRIEKNPIEVIQDEIDNEIDNEFDDARIKAEAKRREAMQRKVESERKADMEREREAKEKARAEAEKAFREIQEEIKNMERHNDHEEFRREQMIKRSKF